MTWRGCSIRRRLSMSLARPIFRVLVRVFSWTNRSSLHKLGVPLRSLHANWAKRNRSYDSSEGMVKAQCSNQKKE